MLATPWASRFDDDRWAFELKWDGIRCLADTRGDGVTLRSRRGNDLTRKYPELADLDMPAGLVLDGEIVAFDASGRPSFELLQGRMNTDFATGATTPVPISYVVFDLLHEGEPLLDDPLESRGDRLASLDLPEPIVCGDRFIGDSEPIWEFVVGRHLEGIVAKRLGSSYQPGSRSDDWRKIGNFKQVRAVVGGFTAGTGGRSATFGSLLLGMWDDDRLRWIGAVGSGFNDKSLAAIKAALSEMVVAESPFHEDPTIPKGVTWVKPHLVAMVRYKQWTRAGRVRAPSFQGFTDDPDSVVTWLEDGPA